MALLKKPKLFYGWWMILFCNLISIYSGGVWLYGFTAFLKPISDEFGWSRAAISAGFSLSRLESAGTGVPAGYLSDRLGPRKVMLAGIVISAAGFVLLSRVNTLGAFYAAIVVLALGYGFGFFVPMATAVANWFNKKIGKAMGFFQGGYAGCGLVPPILILLINGYGWRTTLLLVGVGMLVICGPLTLLIRHKPEPYGYLPDGEEQGGVARGPKRAARPSQEATPAAVPSGPQEFTLRETLRTPSFWLISIGYGMASFGYNAVMVHIIPYLIGIGLSPGLAAFGVTAVSVSSFLGRVGFGVFGDMFKKRYVMAACFALPLVAVLIYARVTAVWLIFLSLVIFGPGYGGSLTLRVAIQRDYFGRKSYGATQGMMLLLAAIPGALGPVFAGWVFDVTRDYRPAYNALALAYLVAVAMILAALPPKKKAPAGAEAAH